MPSKKVESLTIVADKLVDHGRTRPSVAMLEEDYFNIYSAQSLRVENEQQHIVTPVIACLDVINRGYVCTWTSTFWLQGFAVVGGTVYFIGVGKECEYYGRNEVWYRIKPDAPNGQTVAFEIFLATMVEPCEEPECSREVEPDDKIRAALDPKWWLSRRMLTEP
ncbi:MAG: hypothetical protein WCK17_19585 [Verrucomicrobiota bacterium]